MREILGSLLDTLRREPWRAFLTLFGVALGCASIVFLVSLMSGAVSGLGGTSAAAGAMPAPLISSTALPRRPSDMTPSGAGNGSGSLRGVLTGV